MIRPHDARTDRANGTPAVDAARRTLLEELRRSGPVPPGEIPGRWPLTRHHMRLVLAELIRDGLVASERGDGGRLPRLSLTPSGQDALGDGG